MRRFERRKGVGYEYIWARADARRRYIEGAGGGKGLNEGRVAPVSTSKFGVSLCHSAIRLPRQVLCLSITYLTAAGQALLVLPLFLPSPSRLSPPSSYNSIVLYLISSSRSPSTPFTMQDLVVQSSQPTSSHMMKTTKRGRPFLKVSSTHFSSFYSSYRSTYSSYLFVARTPLTCLRPSSCL